jgi:lipopolysaccharide export system permease protein
MKILARYISAIFLKNFLLSLFGLTALYLVQAILGDIFHVSHTVQQVITFYLLGVPEIVMQLIPPAVMTATVLTLSGMGRSNELTACYSIGVGLHQVVILIFALVLLICSVSLVLQDRLLPSFYQKQNTYYWREMRGRQDYQLDAKQSKVWYRSHNLIYNLRVFDPRTQVIHGMSVYEFNDDFDLISVLAAKTARYENENWILEDGTVTTFEEEDRFPAIEEFDEFALNIQETPSDFKEIAREVGSLRLRELARYIERIRETGASTDAFEAKLHGRISLSFMPLVMAFLAIPFSVRGRREGGVAKDLGICLGVTFVYWILYSIGLAIGSRGLMPPVLAAWLPSVLFLGIGIVLMLRKSK